MDFSFTDEQTATGELATQILTDRSTHDHLREIERGDGLRYDDGTWSELAKAGLLGIALPESVGGSGLGVVALGRFLQAVGKTAAAVPVWEVIGLGALPIAGLGSDALQQRWLPGVVDGTVKLTAAWHGSDRDPDTITTTVLADGDTFTASGTVTCVPAGQLADAVVVPALKGDEPGLYVVELGEGTVVRPLGVTGGSPDAAITFNGASAELIATGADAVEWAYERAVATQNAVQLGNAETMLDLTASYTKERKQFDVPIATFQAVGHRVADCYIDCEAMRLTAWQALSRLDDDLPATIEVSVAKHWAATGSHRISIAAAHLHGGVGVDRDYALARHYTRAKELELQLGGSTEHLLRVGRQIAASA